VRTSLPRPAVTFGAGLGAIALVAALLRFPTLAQQSFWTDEAFSHAIVNGSLGHAISTVPRTESTPPVYYVLLWFWAQLFGAGEAGLRSLSAVCGVLAVVVVGEVGRRLVSARVGLFSALLTAVSPIMVWYSQEARAYAMVILLSALSILALLHALERPGRGRLLAWGVCGAAALAVHYFAIFVVVPEACWLGVSLKRRGRLSLDTAFSALAIPVIVGVALLPLVIHQAGNGHATFISTAQGTLPTRVVRLVKQDILGFSEPSKAVFSALGGLLVALGLVLIVWRAAPSERRPLYLPLAVGIGGIVLALIAALAGADYIDTRNLLPTWPALALLIAGGLGAARAGAGGWAGLAGLVAISLACLGVVIGNPLNQRPDWRDLAQALGPAAVSRAIVGNGQTQVSLSPYLSRLSAMPAAGTAISEVDVFALGGLNMPSVPHVSVPPVLPGFRVVQRIATRTYLVLRYRANASVVEPTARLLALGLLPGAGVSALHQSP
jgi:mannosyltransferase